jgi:ABC-2 type transport system permease protein
MSAVGALTRAAWFQARSYRLSLVMQAGGLLMTIVPLYFVANALQPAMEQAIARESTQFFGFILVGSLGLMFAMFALTGLQGAVASGISNGYLESLLMTRASLPSVLVGLTSYGLILTAIRATVGLVAGWVLGAQIVWGNIIPALLILALLGIAHWGIGLVGTALVIAFRTSGPLTTIVTTVSVFFGGVYYPVSAIPSWLGAIAKATPLAYGLQALRRVLLQGEGITAVGPEVAILALMGAGTLSIGSVAILAALRYGKKAGTLGAY